MKKWQFITIVLVFLIAGLLNLYFAEQRDQRQRQGLWNTEVSLDVDGDP